MRQGHVFGLVLLQILGLVALANWSQPSSAQSPAPIKCNVLRDQVPAKPEDPKPVDPAFDSTKLTQLDAAAKKKLLTSGLPCHEIVSGRGPGTPIENLQRGFDFYSWLTFIALNSPASAPQGIETSKPDSPTVWESSDNFKPLLDVMLPDGSKPDWKARIVPPACRSLLAAKPNLMLVKMIEESFNQPFRTGPLIDQRNNYAIFDILMNKSMFEYIVKHELYTRRGQSSEANSTLRIDFLSGHHNLNDGTGDPGAIMIKVSWKILDPEEDKSKFHHVQALVAMPVSAGEQSDPPCIEKTLGLVGFHVVHKTKDRPQWIWTSFEHVDNVPEQKDIDDRKLRPSYNFYDPSCSLANCPINQTPPRPWDPEYKNELKFRTRPDGKFLFNSQIVRVIPLTEATKSINAQFQALLGNTVWKNYILIGTQWPSENPCTKDHSAGAPEPRTDFEKEPDMNCAPAPTYLANSTLETYSQGEIPQASSSCMACHGNAVSYQRAKRHADPSKERPKYFNQSDFTFMLEKAR